MICRINDHPNELYCHIITLGVAWPVLEFVRLFTSSKKYEAFEKKQQHITCKLLALQFASLSHNCFPFTCHVISLKQTTFFRPPVCSILPGGDQDIQLRSEEPGN